MPIEILMPALSPTMEEGTLAKWLVKEGDAVASGDLLAEIETDKATMEFEAVDEGIIGKLLVAEGTENVAVNSAIAVLLEDGESSSEVDAAPSAPASPAPAADAGEEASVADFAGLDMADSGAGAGLADALGAAATSEAASPSSSKTAIALFTATFSVPSATKSLPMMPSSTASNSIVALSVSISASKSPEATVSPSFTNHLASVPSSIVGDSAGIKISIGMIRSP